MNKYKLGLLRTDKYDTYTFYVEKEYSKNGTYRYIVYFIDIFIALLKNPTARLVFNEKGCYANIFIRK